VFPLPELVLFPGVRVPLHVFELRYRTMVRDVLSRDRMLALAVLEPGYEQDYHGSPPFHPLGCLGRIEEIEWLPNDRYDLKVVGVMRVRFGRVAREFPYRTVDVEPLPQHPYAEDDPLVQLDRRALIELHAKLLKLAEAHGGEQAARGLPCIDRADSYEAVVNALSSVCGHSAEERLELLREDSLIERGRRVREALERVVGRRAGGKPGAPGGPEGQRN
jgi:hypothetical protein